jgi:[FeFe] hydrogenase H-cluster maturation GTPase HydF
MIERKHIGIFGRMNVGKSTLMNLLTEQQTSLVDIHPGTTADIKTSVMELHQVGPIKIFDTPGIDEEGPLGKKKKEKTLQALKEIDFVILAIDPFRPENFSFEKEILLLAQKRKKEVFLFFNIFKEKARSEKETLSKVQKITAHLGDFAYLLLDFQSEKCKAVAFIETHCQKKKAKELLPFPLPKDSVVFLNIPLDEESPEGRLLKPQSSVLEYLLRNYISTFVYRMDLSKGRSLDQKVKEGERERFLKNLCGLKRGANLPLLITDSQAMDLIHPWTLSEKKKPLLAITTFSIIMAYQQSGGRLKPMMDGIKALEKLKKGDRLLIAEGCNHNRIAEDIGTIQLPRKIEEKYGKGSILIEHAFGRDLKEYNFSDYQLVIHCGGCMLDAQKFQARMEDLLSAGVPFTNYGMALAYFHSPEALFRVLAPWQSFS